ncbi:MAG: nuclear transport factor 2 family protein [Marinicellaceae bacterium]
MDLFKKNSSNGLRKYFFVFSVLLFHSQFIYSKDLLSLLKDQVDAFNQQDVDKLVANVTEDMKYFYITADELIIETSGKAAFKQAMTNYFSTGNKPQSSIESYVIDGTRISFKEVINYKNKGGKTISSSAMGVYQYKDNKIIRAWYFIE